jgi:hypothetical protein
LTTLEQANPWGCPEQHRAKAHPKLMHGTPSSSTASRDATPTMRGLRRKNDKEWSARLWEYWRGEWIADAPARSCTVKELVSVGTNLALRVLRWRKKAVESLG